jgi:hypothetical protein
MSTGTGNPAELFSVKGMVALVCHRLEVVFFPLALKYICGAPADAVALCNDSQCPPVRPLTKPPAHV